MTHDDLPEHLLNVDPTPTTNWSGMDDPFNQNIRLLLLRAAIDNTLALRGHPLARLTQPAPEHWTDEGLSDFITDELEVADLRALASALQATLELTFRFTEGEPLTVRLESPETDQEE